MNQQSRNKVNSDTSEEICLGIVITAAFERRSEALVQLRQFEAVELGRPSGNRLPGCVVVRRGHDKELIEKIEALPAVARVEVAFAQVIEEESP